MSNTQPKALRFTKKPVTITASQWFKSGDHPAVRVISDSDDLYFTGMGGTTLIEREKFGVIGTLESPNHLVTPGDWIITGVQGEHYPCKPDIFEATYESEQASRRSQTAPQGWKPVQIELLERIQESLGSFLSDQGWSQSDLDTADALGGLLATVPELPAQPGWCDGCSPDNCPGCGIAASNDHHHTRKDQLGEGEKAEQTLNFATKPVGAFVRSRFGDKVTFHRDCADKAQLLAILDENLSGGPYSAEYAYTESQVRAILVNDRVARALHEAPMKERVTVPADASSVVLPEPSAWMLGYQTMVGDVGWKLSFSQSGAGICQRLKGEEYEKRLYTEQQVRALLAAQTCNKRGLDNEC